jgi:hypothetical protein
MKISNEINNCDIHVINLMQRTDKKKYIIDHLQKNKIEHYSFFYAQKHKNPKRGCLESHLQIIKNSRHISIQGKYNQLLLFEDDVKIIRSLANIKNVPSDWDMLYLGGTVHRVMDKKYPNFPRVQCWTTHAYIINLENKILVDKILEAENYDGEIDRYYLEKIHPYFHCYMCDPMIAIQKEGYSDIEGRDVNYDFMQDTLQGLLLPESSIDNEGNYILKLPNIREEDLPKVSIITPTYKRRKIFSMAIRNFENFIYPKNKLEWIIVDDSPPDDSIEDLLPRDKRIKYIYMESSDGDDPMTISMKRNIAVSNSSNPYIIHMDDDDYYPPESILARIKILLKYKDKGIECVGSTLIGTYNILKNTSSMSSDGPISLSEASMGYTKKFWEARPFDENCKRGEHKYFTEQRLNKIMDIPYSFIIIAVNHRDNFTNELRTDNSGLLRYSDQTDKEGEYANFFDSWDLETQFFVMELRNYLLK